MTRREAESYGYTGKILRVDLRSDETSVLKRMRTSTAATSAGEGSSPIFS